MNANISDNFEDLDDPITYKQHLSALLRPDTHNFALSFNADKAESRLNLEADDLVDFFDADNNSEGEVRWLNFWHWDESYKPVFEKIARKYKISPRLVALIWPKIAPEPIPVVHEDDDTSSLSPTGSGKPIDLEKGGHLRRKWTQFMHRDHTHSKPKPALPQSGFGNIADSLWHFCSVDSGFDYIHIGFNQLFVPPLPKNHSCQADQDRPAGIRIWTSILLCGDGTVISVFEPPPVGFRVDPTVLKVLRRNVINIFRNLSRLHTPSAEEQMFQVTIRQPPTNTDDVSIAALAKSQASMSSLLFYYLFDDWFTSYALISRREHPYRKKLEDIRGAMFKAAAIDAVHDLHQIGRQLGVLSLMYHSYELIVTRLLSSQRVRQNQSQPMQQNSFGLAQFSSFEMAGSDHDGEEPELTHDTPRGSQVRLSTASLVRFERLLDRIRLYALTEIDSCLKEKEELVFMNFNLITLRESHTVEKLTRTTILLAKVSVVFAPLGLLTAYFGLSLDEINQFYDLKTYWVAFGVVTILTLLYLVFFELASSKVGHGFGYKSFTKAVWEKSRSKMNEHHQKQIDSQMQHG